MYLHGFDEKTSVCSLQYHEVLMLKSQSYVMLWVRSVLLFILKIYKPKDLQVLQNRFRSPVDRVFQMLSHLHPPTNPILTSHKTTLGGVRCNLTPTCTDLLRSNYSRKILPLASVLLSKFKSTDYPYHYCWFQKNTWYFCLLVPSLHFEYVLMCVF